VYGLNQSCRLLKLMSGFAVVSVDFIIGLSTPAGVFH
jgi:hypothetical protein